MSRRYVFKKRWLRYLMMGIDSLGWIAKSVILTLSVAKRKDLSPQSYLIIRCDQIGDIVLSQPFLTTLKEKKPKSRLVFLTTPFGKALFKNLAEIDEIVEFSPRWFSRSRGWLYQFSDFIKLIGLLRKYPVDVIIDLRGDVRHLLASKLAQPKASLISYGITGGGFLCDIEEDYPWGDHAAQKNLKLLKCIGIPTPMEPELSSKMGSDPLSHELDFSKNNSIRMALHAGTHTPSKEWPVRQWEELSQSLVKIPGVQLFFIGDGQSKNFLPKNFSQYGVDLCGKIPLSQLGTFLKQCHLLVSVDSGPVHIAAAHQVPTLELFSSENNLSEWKPLNPHLVLLEAHSMKDLMVDRVIKKLRGMIELSR